MIWIAWLACLSGCRHTSDQSPSDTPTDDPGDGETTGDTQTDRDFDTGTSGDTESDTRAAALTDALLPIAVGNAWTYDVVAHSDGALCAEGRYVSEITETVTVDSQTAYNIISFCNFEGWGQTSSLLRFDESDQSVDRYYGNWFALIAPPLEAGHTWSCEHGQCQWVFAGTRTTPAGAFDDCWQRTPVNPDDDAYTDTYCRGVGLVESVIDDNYTATLIEYRLVGADNAGPLDGN